MRLLTSLLLLVLLCFEASAVHHSRDTSGIDGVLDASIDTHTDTDIDTDIDTATALTPIQESAATLIKQKKYAELLKTNVEALKKRQKKWDKKQLYIPNKFDSKERMKYPKDKPISLETDGDTEKQRPLYIEQSSTIDTRVSAPGDCQHLSVTDGDSTWILTNGPLNALAANQFVVRGAAPNAAFTVTFQIEHAAFAHTVWTRINGVDTALVLQNGRVTFQVPAAANGQFSIIYGNAIAPLIPVTTFAIVFTYQELTVGLEIEDIATVLFCWDGGAGAAAPHAFPGLGNVATHCDNLQQDDRVTHTVNNVPGTNWPFLKIELDAINGRVGHTEYITGPLPVGRTGGVPADLRDEQVALSLLLQTFTAELDAAGAGACAGNGDQGWTLFSTVIAAYNVALAANLGLFTTPANWILVPPTAGQNVKVDGGAAAHPLNVGGNYNWYVQCNYAWDANMGANMQVNFAVPLRSIGARKMAAPTTNLPTHFIDLFPPPNEDGVGHWSRYVTRSQWIAHQLIFAPRVSWLAAQLRALNPAPRQTTLIQLKGWMASFLMTVIHKVQVACATNRLPHGAPGLDHGASKNFHFNMFKSCLNDLPRYFPRAIGNLLARWWTGAHLPGAGPAARHAALIAGIRDLFERRASWWVGHLNLQNDGRLDTTECQTYQPLHPLTGLPLGGQVLAAAHFTNSWGIVMQSDQIVSTFTPTLAWQPRYPNEGAPVAVPVNMGDQGINVGVNPGANWECMCGVNHPRTIPPLQNLLYGELGMVVESRETGRPLNQAFMPTADPNNIKDVMAGITIIRNVGTQPGSIAQ